MLDKPAVADADAGDAAIADCAMANTFGSNGAITALERGNRIEDWLCDLMIGDVTIESRVITSIIKRRFDKAFDTAWLETSKDADWKPARRTTKWKLHCEEGVA